MQTRLCIFTIALLMSAFAIAQVGGGGTIQGTITDPSGAVVTGAEVAATNVATGVQTTAKTTDAGFFVLTPLQPGEYTVIVKAQGFQNRHAGTRGSRSVGEHRIEYEAASREPPIRP